MDAIKQLCVSVFLTLIACASPPPSGSPLIQRMNQIDETYRSSVKDSEETRKEKQFLAGQARVDAMKSREESRLFKNTILRTTLAERQCPEWRSNFVLEAIECKAIYSYALYLKMECEDKTLRVPSGTEVKWKIASHEGLTSVNQSSAILVRFQKNRTTQTVNGPPLEDPDAPTTVQVLINKRIFEISSHQFAEEPLVLPSTFCR